MKILLRTFGCRANQYDSEAVRTMVERGGHEIVADPSLADVAVFNSCAVTTQAEAELRKAVRHTARLNPGLRTTIMGCASALPSREGHGNLRSLPTVTDLIPGADLQALASSLGMAVPSGLLTEMQSGARALLRVQDGCDAHCTFCATTLARGANRSRPVADLIAEARVLAAHHPEIVLTGIHIGTYGADIESSLGELVARLIEAVPLVRFRLTSVEATEIDARLAELLVSDPYRLAPSLHAPLQSGSDAVLKRMGRHWYTSSGYARAVEALLARTPIFGLGADVICGFPGETEADHAATVALVRQLPFTYLHVFPYSVRPGTAAERLPAHVASATIAARAAEFREIGSAKAAAYAASRAGGRADIVVLSRGVGMTEDYLTLSLSNHEIPRRERFSARLAMVDGGLTATATGPR